MAHAERRAAGSSAPKTACGIKICWGYNAHSGCSAVECQHAHEFYRNYDTLSLPLKMCLVKRQGFKNKPKIPVAKNGETIKELRRVAKQEADARRSAPGARGDSDPSGPASLRVVGTSVPPESGGGNSPKLINCVDSEEVLRTALHGGGARIRNATATD